MKEKYQIVEKANYLNLLILIDELKAYDKNLSKLVEDKESWTDKFRNTRNVFISLNNLRDIMNKINLNISEEYIALNRDLKKKLAFANHFRNRAAGHLNETLLERAVQWSPQLFCKETKENIDYKIAEAHRVIIESCINSYIDEKGIQKIFNTEIDLMYPADFKLFFTYLQELIIESLEWLTISSNHILQSIEHHDETKIKELAAVAAKTNFNLKEESEYNYPKEKQEKQLLMVLEELEKMNTEKEVIDFLKSRFQELK